MIVRTQRGSIDGGKVVFNDRYAWEGDDYAPLRSEAALWRYAIDGELEYWAAELHLNPPRMRYRFGFETAEGTRWYGADGLRDQPSPRGAFEFAYISEGDRPEYPEWARGATFYHIFPDRFARSAAGHRRGPVEPWDAPVDKRTFLGGDLDGIVERLDHISSLSVNALYLTPIFSAPSNHKYDTADYFTVDPDFGGNAALRRLLAAVHERGMKLVLDGVFNHAGAGWPPFVDAQQRGKDSPYASWFYFADDADDKIGYETWSVNVRTLPKLRTSEPAVRDLVCRIGRFWVQEFGIDGWRLDVANEVDHATWRAFRAAVRAVDPESFLLGEVWMSALPWLRGDQFDSVMNYPWREAILGYAGGDDAGADRFLDAIDGIRAAYPEPGHSFLYNLLGSHDEDRPLHELHESRDAMAFAAGLLYSLPGIVSIYYGDEVGMTGDNDPGSRNGMVWDEARQDARLLQLYRRLGATRRKSAALRDGRYERLAADGTVAAFVRQSGDERVVVVANPTGEQHDVPSARSGEWLGRSAQVLETISYQPAEASLAGGTLRLPPRSLTLVASAQGTKDGWR